VKEPYKKEWFDVIFDDYYLMFDGHGDTTCEVAGIISMTGVWPSARVLDVGCGYGRHAVEFARHGYKVTGLDLSKRMLAAAEEAARSAQVEAKFVEADMRQLSYSGEFDLVTNLFSSFGYFDDLGNQALVGAMFTALAPNGKVVLDQTNKYRHHCSMKFQETASAEDVEFRKVAFFDDKTGMYTGTYTYTTPTKETVEHPFVIHLYKRDQLADMFRIAGFERLLFYGDFQGNHLDSSSPRMIMVAEKN
jgi:SAM-dependent methyltransferase